MNLKIIYEDDYILAVDKPYNMAVHPSILHYENSLSNGVKYYFELIGLNRKIRPVNRLDRDTTGIVLFAKNEYIQECLIRQMNSKLFYKEYLAILEGLLENSKDIINAPIARKDDSIIERCISKDGAKAISHYEVIDSKNNLSLVKFILETGRTHQIRLHSKHIGHPIIGDTLYGNESNLISRQALHCHKISFVHPVSKNKLEIISPIPEDIKKAIN
jgi:23S rRNA pseudouridine1911/1915/1917 synthase